MARPGRPRLAEGLKAEPTSLRLSAVYRAALDELVEDANRRAGGLADIDRTDLIRALIVREFRERGLTLPEGTPGAHVFGAAAVPPPAPPARRAERRPEPPRRFEPPPQFEPPRRPEPPRRFEPPPQFEPSRRFEPPPPVAPPHVQLYRTLNRLARGDPNELVDAAVLVAESELPIAVAHDALDYLAEQRHVELRMDSRAPAEVRQGPLGAFYPRTRNGLIGYVTLMPSTR